jgi:adenine/guanine phosphoribosyltransferase-like PRPP-binding protein
VDDVLSTGGTLKAVLSTLKRIGVIIKGIFIAVDKGNVAEKIKDEFKINIDVLINIDVVDGKVVIKNI